MSERLDGGRKTTTTHTKHTRHTLTLTFSHFQGQTDAHACAASQASFNSKHFGQEPPLSGLRQRVCEQRLRALKWSCKNYFYDMALSSLSLTPSHTPHHLLPTFPGCCQGPCCTSLFPLLSLSREMLSVSTKMNLKQGGRKQKMYHERDET